MWAAAARMTTRLPGSGGACDLASLAQRHVIIMAHEKRRFVPQVDYITSPGYGNGPGWRQAVGLPRGGPSAVITTLGVLEFDPEDREMVLIALHPGVDRRPGPSQYRLGTENRTAIEAYTGAHDG